jgi:hypothetical protein
LHPVVDRTRDLVVGLAGLQLADALGNRLVSQEFVSHHLDHLGVPQVLRPTLSPIKVASSAGLLLGLRLPRLGAVTSAGLVAYYAFAVGFHLRAGDHPVAALPAALLGASAAVALTKRFLR